MYGIIIVIIIITLGVLLSKGQRQVAEDEERILEKIRYNKYKNSTK